MPTVTHPAQQIANVIDAAAGVILGKRDEIRLALACLLASGHLLIEDFSGVGKTILAHTLARLLGLHFQRIQFTSDLLPADILGVSVFDRNESVFRFIPGPIFSQLVLADEINRATPKAQSALLEAMEERQVTVEGETRPLPHPFFVIATQNPSHQVGTFSLPESQLDRFMMKLALGYPDAVAERALLTAGDARLRLPELSPVLAAEQLPQLQAAVRDVRTSPALIDYVQALVAASRQTPEFEHGLSPRAALALLSTAKAWGFIDGRNHALPEDVQAVFRPTVAHRLRQSGSSRPALPEQLATLLGNTPIP